MNSGFLTSEQVNTFREIIASYSPGERAQKAFAESEFAVLAGPAVAGKDTLRESLLASYPDYYQKVISATTRSPRSEEKDAYKFVTVNEMINLAKQKKLLQLALVHNQQVSATDIEEIKSIQKGKIGLSILIVQAEQELHRLKPDIKTIFLIPPSYEDFIRRIKEERVTAEDEIKRRLASAKSEINIALETKRYYMLVSDEQENVKVKSDEFLRYGKRDDKEEQRAKKVCREILNKVVNEV